MAKLAIKGSEVRAKEIMELINILAPGINTNGCNGSKLRMVYILDDSSLTEMPYSKSTLSDDVMVFEYKEFMSKHPYKLDDLVRTIWGNIGRITSMRWDRDLNSVIYELNSSGKFYSTNNIFIYESEYMSPVKSSNQESTEDDLVDLATSVEVDKAKAPTLVGINYSNKCYGYPIPKGYKFDKISDGIVYLIPIDLPKTYNECCEVLELEELDCQELTVDIPLSYYNSLMENLSKLIICRNAYWKLANNWEPDWKAHDLKYCILIDEDEIITKDSITVSYLLAFPTKDMRDEFLKNFRDLIKLCKKLL